MDKRSKLFRATDGNMEKTCYKLFRGYVTFKEAHYKCLTWNGTLAYPKDKETLELMKQYQVYGLAEEAWLGLWVKLNTFKNATGNIISVDHMGLKYASSTSTCVVIKNHIYNGIGPNFRNWVAMEYMVKTRLTITLMVVRTIKLMVSHVYTIYFIVVRPYLFNSVQYPAHDVTYYKCQKLGHFVKVCLKVGQIDIFRFKCPAGYAWNQITDTCYKLYTESMSIAEAAMTCSKDNSRLAMIKTSADTEFIQANLSVRNWTWFGLKLFSSSDMFHGMFSDRSFLTTNDYTNWNDYDNSYQIWINSNALIADKEAKWYLGTTNKAGALCEYVGVCPPDYILYENSCYKLFEAADTFFKAQVLCALDGGRLYKLDKGSSQENLAIHILEKRSIWSGVNWNERLNKWMGSDGLPIEIDISNTGITGNICLKIVFDNNEYHYISTSCESKLQFFCQIDCKYEQHETSFTWFISISFTWKFSATSHGKGIIDGNGGRAKYLVRHKVMSKSSTPLIIQNSQDFANAANQLMEKTTVIHISQRQINEFNEKYDGFKNIRVNVMEKAGTHYKWPNVQDNIFYPYDDCHYEISASSHLKTCPLGMIPFHRQCVVVISDKTPTSERNKMFRCYETGTEMLGLPGNDDIAFGKVLGNLLNVKTVYTAYKNGTFVLDACAGGCLFNIATLCQAPDTLCPLNYNYMNVEGLESCVKVHNDISTKSEAEASCQGNLAHPKYHTMLDSYKSFTGLNKLESNNNSKFYVGIQVDSASIGYWKYSDNISVYLPRNSWTDLLYSTYAITDKVCTVFNAESGKLEPIDCSEKLGFLCEEPVNSVCSQIYHSEMTGDCQSVVSEDPTWSFAACLETAQILTINHTDPSQLNEVSYSAEILSGHLNLFFYDSIHNAASFYPAQPSSVCHSLGMDNSGVDYNLFEGIFINITEIPQNFYVSTVSCAEKYSVLFYDENRSIHNYLRKVLKKYGVTSYWIGTPHPNNESEWAGISGRTETYPPGVVNFFMIPKDDGQCQIFKNEVGSDRWILYTVSCKEEHSSICAFKDDVCPTNFLNINGRCYMLYEEKMSMAKGDAFCSVLHSKMATIAVDDSDYLRVILDQKDVKKAWIVQDFNYGKDVECSAINDIGEIVPISCSENLNPICEKLQNECPQYFVFYRGDCIYISDYPATYLESLKICGQYNLTVAIILDEQFNDFLAYYISMRNISQVWILPQYGLDFTKMAANMQQSTCMVLTKENVWFPQDCQLIHNFVCQKEQNITTTSTSTIAATSTTTFISTSTPTPNTTFISTSTLISTSTSTLQTKTASNMKPASTYSSIPDSFSDEVAVHGALLSVYSKLSSAKSIPSLFESQKLYKTKHAAITVETFYNTEFCRETDGNMEKTCYKLFRGYVTFPEAQQNCVKWNGSLAYPKDIETLELMKQYQVYG
ncbi:hypothetical protein GQR58_002516 [Nymphon striatum]|nr:hypothetical protein GQR58_002516 [Nymphon striatum]